MSKSLNRLGRCLVRWGRGSSRPDSAGEGLDQSTRRERRPHLAISPSRARWFSVSPASLYIVSPGNSSPSLGVPRDVSVGRRLDPVPPSPLERPQHSRSLYSQFLSLAPSEEKKKQQPNAEISDGKRKDKAVKKQKSLEHHQDEEAQINENLKPKMDKKKKKKKTSNEETNDVSGEMEPKIPARTNRTVVTDRRFESLHYDPKFQSVPKQQSKVTIDERFESIFTDKSFAASSAPVEKRGKSRKGKSENPLLNYYINQNDPLKAGKSGQLNGFEPTLLGAEDEDGMSTGSTTSTSSDEEDYDESINSDVAHNLMADHESTSRTEEPTHRLAVVNMDWNRIKSVDIYVTMTSSLPKDGHVMSVNVYPSEFGRECMEIEATQGPSSLIYGKDKQKTDTDDDDDSEEDYDDAKENEKLRMYELNKLRYYYAVVDCDSSRTANYLYEELDGTELLKTSNVFDLRFIPDSMECNHPPRDTITEAPTSYTPPDFQTRAVQHSNVKLTWEEDEPERKKILKRKFNTKQVSEV